MPTTPEQAKAVADGLKQTVAMNQKFIANVLSEKPNEIYSIDDYGKIRTLLFDNVKKAVADRFPLVNQRYSLTVEDLDYDDPEEIDVDEQKQIILQGKSSTRRLRGSWVLKDADGKELSRTRRMTLMRVPRMTERGSFIRNGKEYVFSNILRMEPGVYTKKKNDEVSAQFNVKQGSGSGFGMELNPSSGVFRITRGTTNAPAYTVLKDMGVSDEQLQAAWGKELFEINRSAGMNAKARTAADNIYQ